MIQSHILLPLKQHPADSVELVFINKLILFIKSLKLVWQ